MIVFFVSKVETLSELHVILYLKIINELPSIARIIFWGGFGIKIRILECCYSQENFSTELKPRTLIFDKNPIARCTFRIINAFNCNVAYN